MQFQITKHLGNLLIIIALVGLTYTIYPLIKSEFDFRTGQVPQLAPDATFTINLSTIAAAATVIPNVNSNNAQEYQLALKQGVAHVSGSPTPDKAGTVYLFAHSSAPPWELAHTNTAFFRLNRLQLGDPITITYHGQTYHYQVTETKVVWPTETQYLTQETETQLILQTCTPIGTDFKRLLIFAKPL